jgi:hypothetical protein
MPEGLGPQVEMDKGTIHPILREAEGGEVTVWPGVPATRPGALENKLAVHMAMLELCSVVWAVQQAGLAERKGCIDVGHATGPEIPP